MISKENMLKYIDKSIDTLKEDLKKYIDESVKENEAEYIFYNNYFKYNESLYNIDPNKIKLGDIVFGIVSKDKVEDDRYPFRVIYKNNDKLILLGIKRLDDCSFSKAYDLRWNISYYLNKKPYIQSNCSIISKELINEYNLDSLLSEQNLAVGFCYWTRTRNINYSSNAWYVNSTGRVTTTAMSIARRAPPHVIINL